ncbi:MAG TPA: DNA polymerase III subunit delta [Pyrinomonadaceae bacterium]|nr:DNA polymerase III subunit delta [Pyrinomonadaceae bacterium]
MPTRTRRDLEQSLKKGQIEPVYFLYGGEAYLRDQALREITDAALSGTLLREFNDSSFNLFSDDVRDAIAAAEQLPMMSERRVVRLRNFARLRESDEEVLFAYLGRPVETSVVIFVGDDIDKRRKLGKKLMSGAGAFEFQPLKPNELPTWIKAHLKGINADIEPRALSQLIELSASDLSALTNELNKLAAAALPSGRITSELVDQLVSRSREHMNWDLTDNIVARNRRAALKVLRDFLDDGVEPVLLTGVIAGTFRRMALAKALHARGASPGEIFREVRVPPFKQRDYLAMLNRIDSATMSRMIQRIAETDLAIKTSKATPRMQMEMLVCELMI